VLTMDSNLAACLRLVSIANKPFASSSTSLMRMDAPQRSSLLSQWHGEDVVEHEAAASQILLIVSNVNWRITNLVLPTI